MFEFNNFLDFNGPMGQFCEQMLLKRFLKPTMTISMKMFDNMFLKTCLFI